MFLCCLEVRAESEVGDLSGEALCCMYVCFSGF
jgi:hypothetical protein